MHKVRTSFQRCSCVSVADHPHYPERGAGWLARSLVVVAGVVSTADSSTTGKVLRTVPLEHTLEYAPSLERSLAVAEDVRGLEAMRTVDAASASAAREWSCVGPSRLMKLPTPGHARSSAASDRSKADLCVREKNAKTPHIFSVNLPFSSSFARQLNITTQR